MTELQVDLHGQRIGRISGDNRSFDFHFDDQALARFGAGSAALSVAMLVTNPLPRAHRERRQNFFAELLPEGRNREWLVAQAGLSYGDVLGILSTYGRDIAGAIEIWDPTAPGEPRTPDLIAVSDAEIAETLRDMAAMPLGNVPGRGASSVAGVQAKLVLAQEDGAWHRPVGGYPSTHIVKPADAGAPPSTIWDEEYGMRIARRLGLASHHTSVRSFDGRAALISERYDRDCSDPTRRIHQEDFNQALGASGDQKYQRPGGKVSLTRIAAVVKTHCTATDLRALARRTVASVVLGDLDMHAKNISLLHPASGDVELAPAYDVVPHAHLVPAGDLALAVGGEYQHQALTRMHLVDEVSSWGLRTADAVVSQALEETHAALKSELPLEGAGPGLQETTIRTARSLLDGRAIGAVSK